MESGKKLEVVTETNTGKLHLSNIRSLLINTVSGLEQYQLYEKRSKLFSSLLENNPEGYLKYQLRAQKFCGHFSSGRMEYFDDGKLHIKNLCTLGSKHDNDALLEYYQTMGVSTQQSQIGEQLYVPVNNVLREGLTPTFNIPQAMDQAECNKILAGLMVLFESPEYVLTKYDLYKLFHLCVPDLGGLFVLNYCDILNRALEKSFDEIGSHYEIGGPNVLILAPGKYDCVCTSEAEYGYRLGNEDYISYISVQMHANKHGSYTWL